MGDANPIRTLGDYSKPSHEGYRNTIELPEGFHVVPLRSDTIERIVKLRNDIPMFQQHQGESISEAWTRFKDLLRKVPHHGIDLWLQVQIFYDRIDHILKRTIDYAAKGRSEDVCGMTSDMMRQLPPKPSRQEAFEDLVMNFILDQEEKVKQLEEYMSVIGSDFMQLSLEVIFDEKKLGSS
uniref:Zinc finger, CCHC-type n=1 Tax=Tanacetum cinerariifolium TaxID=118510 RepID=A0A6L2JQ32_TANCI|nr:zinc finger, CCHC-type [Tanacetum cinerariifolium]